MSQASSNSTSFAGPGSFRWLLAGDDHQLQPRGAVVVVAAALGATLAGCLGSAVGFSSDPADLFSSAPPDLAGQVLARAANGGIGIALALVVAAGIARWHGDRLGTLAGIALATSFGGPLGGVSPLVALTALSLTATLGTFALGNIPSRMPPVETPIPRLTFWIWLSIGTVLAGSVVPLTVLATCSIVVIARGDSRVLRWLAFWPGIAIALAALILRLGLADGAVTLEPAAVPPGGDLIGAWLAVGWIGLPWTPLAVAGLLWGIRQGYDADPFWQLTIAWLFTSLTLAAAAAEFRPYACLAGPPLAMLAAVATRRAWVLVRLRP